MRKLVSGTLGVGFALLTACDMDPSLAAYNQLKQAEAQIPVPADYVVKSIGTYDCAAGTWNGPIHISSFCMPTVKGNCVPTTNNSLTPITVNGFHAGLRYNVTNATSPVTVSAARVTASAPAGASYVDSNVGTYAGEVDWSISCGTHSMSSKFNLVRPEVIGGGAFTVAALPIGVLYEPPMDPQRTNYATYTQSTAFGSTVGVTYSNSSQTRTSAPTPFDDVNQFTSNAKTLASGLSKIPSPYTTAAAGFLDTLASLMGSASSTLTIGSTVTNGHTLIVNRSDQTTLQTSAGLGPGLGDIVMYLQDVRMVWVGNAGVPHTALLGYRTVAETTVKTLLADYNSGQVTGPVTGLPRDTLKSLLLLDPFVDGRTMTVNPAAYLDPNRFLFKTSDTYEGVIVTHSYTYSTSELSSASNVSFQTQATDYSSGALAFLGIGVTEDKHLVTNVTNSSLIDTTTTRTSSVSVTLHAPVGSPQTVRVYVDKVFGTFAFQKG